MNQDGPSLIIEAPPPPRPPNSQRCLIMFSTYEQLFIRLLPYFACCWEDSFGVKSISKFPWGFDIEAYIKNVYGFWRPGDTFAVAGDRAI